MRQIKGNRNFEVIRYDTNREKGLFFAIQKRYRKANKAKKTQILNEFCHICGYHRKYAIGRLSYSSTFYFEAMRSYNVGQDGCRISATAPPFS